MDRETACLIDKNRAKIAREDQLLECCGVFDDVAPREEKMGLQHSGAVGPVSVIENFDQNFLLGISELDDEHREFIELVDALSDAHKAAFVWGFLRLLEHTAEHFEQELALMRSSDFQDLEKHQAEHQRVLDDLNHFADQVVRGRIALARAFLRDVVPNWFSVHATTMDQELATHLKAGAPPFGKTRQ